MNDPERSAIARAAGGDFTDLQLLLLEHCEVLRHRVAGEIPSDLRGLASVDDVLQDICVEAIRDIHRFTYRGPGSFRAWLNEIARTCLLDLVRTHRRKKRGGQRVAMHLSWVDVAELASANTEHLTLPLTPSRVAHTREVVQAVQLAVAQLPENERHAMRLYYLQQWPTEQVAEELNISPGAVRALLQRARKRLCTLLEPASAWLSRHE